MNYTLTDGVHTYPGTAADSCTSEISFVIDGVAQGSGYILAPSTTSEDGLVTCAGASAPFDVDEGENALATVRLVCTPKATCQVWNTAAPVALYVGPGPGSTAGLVGNTQGLDPKTLSFAWSVLSGAGTITGETPDGTGGDTATFACATTVAAVTLQLVVTHGPLPPDESCSAMDTTATVKVDCGARA